MAKSDKRHDYFRKLYKKDRILKWIRENHIHGGYYNLRLDQLRRYAGVDRFEFVYRSHDFFKQIWLKKSSLMLYCVSGYGLGFQSTLPTDILCD